ncbi:hypothetical protein [Thermobrachium celere]|uniref:Uncharacterized protein n=1 Tax=Thermobrachium celere DSM 8682 TaxID=941824 RepID=R7RS27_9CLOT|nr:hypothetical protein [Thermobrachium celere]CDF58191.1 hypothetical protein TCEL_00237 [Thermobrachium celere DSM 8682]
MKKILRFIVVFLVVLFIIFLIKGLLYFVLSFIELKPEGDAKLVMYNLDKKNNNLIWILINKLLLR